MIYYRLSSAEAGQVIGLLYELYCAPLAARRARPRHAALRRA